MDQQDDQEPRHSELPVGNWTDPEWPGPGKVEQAVAVRGCGDFGCVIEKPKGQGTNGGCRCSPLKVKKWALEVVAKKLDEKAKVFDAKDMHLFAMELTRLAEQIRALK